MNCVHLDARMSVRRCCLVLCPLIFLFKYDSIHGDSHSPDSYLNMIVSQATHTVQILI